MPIPSEKVELVLKDKGETWTEGPCRQCECVPTAAGTLYDSCTKFNCPPPPEDFNYKYQTIAVPGECCPTYKQIGCIFDGIVHNVGETWTPEGEYCVNYQCNATDTGVETIKQVKHCETTCDFGSAYVPASVDDKTCCGSCKVVGCIVDDLIYAIGDTWTSEDNCINYICSNENNLVHVKSNVITCPEVSDEMKENYVMKEVVVAGACCKDVVPTACKADGKIYQIGESWPSPDGDKCKSVTCIQNSLNEITKQEMTKTCNKECGTGWEYKESDYQCCGKCVQTACVVNDELKSLGEKWTSEDGCTTYSCEMMQQQLTIVTETESCPDVSQCAPYNLYKMGCCNYCNITVEPLSECVIMPMELEDTVGAIVTEDKDHGRCINKEKLNNLNECIGSCESFTMYDKVQAQYESQCSCCQAVSFTTIFVQLDCEDGYTLTKQIPVPSQCRCSKCGGQE